MDNFLNNLPALADLKRNPGTQNRTLFEVNGHIHSPYSFSAFTNVRQIVDLAMAEKVEVLGINDFYTTGGYREFHDLTVANGIFPLFNIEFIALDRKLQQEGIRVNDPNNPGRIYFSGKGLDYPEVPDAARMATVDSVISESHRQVREMVIKTNEVLSGLKCGITLNFDEIKTRYAAGLVRERHIAMALRISIFDTYRTNSERFAFLTALYDGREPKADLESAAAVEIEIRNNFLKAGGKAFVTEDEKAFLTVEAVMELIKNAGGIPCYPVLLDDAKGNFTDFEGDRNALLSDLTSRGIFCIELIPGRNDATILADFVWFFRDNGFVILFGTEHNTPDLAPLSVSCRHQVPLEADVRQAGSDGACIIAAHQYFRANGYDSPVSSWASLSAVERESILDTGRGVLNHYLKH